MIKIFQRGVVFTLLVFLVACASTGKSGQSTSTTHPTPTAMPAPYATGTAAVALKITAAAQATETAAALPTATPTIVITPAVYLCHAGDLNGKVHAEGATGWMTFSVDLTNTGTTACSLVGPPQIRLVNVAGQALDLQTQLNCFGCNPESNDYATPLPATQTAVAPTETATAHEILDRKVNLEPGQSANIFVLWRNWCKPFPQGGVSVKLKLQQGSGTIGIPTDATTGGRCDVPDAGSTLIISQYRIP